MKIVKGGVVGFIGQGQERAMNACSILLSLVESGSSSMSLSENSSIYVSHTVHAYEALLA
jgi:hypothetical protein